MRARWPIGIGVILFCGIYHAGAMVFMLPKEEKKPAPPSVEQAQDKTPAKESSRATDDFYSLSPSDLQKIETYVKAMPGIEDRRITTALDKLESGLPDYSQQDCSQGVRKAIMAERGIDIFRGATSKEVNTVNGREAATNYGLDRMLRRNGYELISPGANYTPQRGDVQCISYGTTINGYGGHVQYYDGTDWISDHKQRGSAAAPDALRAEGLDPNKVAVWTYRRKT